MQPAKSHDAIMQNKEYECEEIGCHKQLQSSVCLEMLVRTTRRDMNTDVKYMIFDLCLKKLSQNGYPSTGEITVCDYARTKTECQEIEID